jgi:hypothetical protein
VRKNYLKMPLNYKLTDEHIVQARKRRGIETAGFAGTLTITDIDKCFTPNLATIKEEAFIKSIAASTRIEGSSVSNDGVRQIIINERIAKIKSHLNTADEKRVALCLAYKPGVTIAEIVNTATEDKTSETEKAVASLLSRNLIVESGIGYEIIK